MKKILLLLILSFSLCSITGVYSQSQPGCGLHISSGFDTECLLTDYIKCCPDLLEMDVQDCMLVCKGNIVWYTVECANASQYTWTVSGAADYSIADQGRTVYVRWGYGMVGTVSVSAVVGDTNTCTAETCIVLMDSPTANSSSVPAYYYNQDGDREIEICLGETIEFTDMSATPRTPITGHLWQTPFGEATTQDYSFTPPQEGVYEIYHCVRNECGCEDCEMYYIVVKEPMVFELSCYGTVCENTIASYHLENAPCDDVMWNVEGGSLEGQGTQDLTVHWGSPTSGYGVISMQSVSCETECPSLYSVRIPVIVNNAEIEGPEEVCVGEVQVYELQRWGGTEYTWWNSDTACLTVHHSESPNRYMLEFTCPDTVTIGASYNCPFLDCGYKMSSPKTIIIKDTMSVHSDRDTYCKGETGVFRTTRGGTVRWRVYAPNDSLVRTADADTLSHIFPSAGQYRVTASASGYCTALDFYVTVLDDPPALTSATGPHSACRNSSILLEAVPTHPGYYLQWIPLCVSVPLDTLEGNEVTVTYGSEICDVAVFQVDREYGCRSEAYVHRVYTFQLLPHGLPAVTSVCAGSTVRFDVPDQSPDVLYEWTIDPTNAASIDSSDHLLPSVGILTNHLANVATPYYVDVVLKRTYCSGIKVYDTVRLLVNETPVPVLDCPDTVCEGDVVSLVAAWGVPAGGPFQWSFSDTAQVLYGDSVFRRFDTPGRVYVTLTANPGPNCNPVTVRDTVWVSRIPYVDIVENWNNLEVQYYPNAQYVWTYNGAEVAYTSICPITGEGTYCCTATSTVPPYCSDSACYNVPYGSPNCITMPTTHTLQCNTATVTAYNPSGLQFSWSPSTSALGSHCEPAQSSSSTTATFNVPGLHYVYAYAEANGRCYISREQVRIDCVPAIEVSYDCNGHLVVRDVSQYRDGFSIPDRTVTINGTSLSVTLYSPQMSVSIPTATLNEGIYTVNMSFDNTGCACSKEFRYEFNPRIYSIDIRDNMCSETPFLFTATTGGNIARYEWDFGDNSHNEGDSIYHTYHTSINLNPCVHLTVTNSLGCSAEKDTCINVLTNALIPANIAPTSDIKVCPGFARELVYTQYPNLSVNLLWIPVDLTFDNYQNYCNVYQTGDYSVDALQSSTGCRAQAMLNVGFLTAPLARIVGSTEYCFGEAVKLNGNTGVRNTYSWSVAGPSNYSFTSSESNISFTPSQPGTYTVVLDVNNGNCGATATCTVTVNPKPAAPTIAFCGNRCIHDAPVEVCSTTGQNLCWSNGYRGSTAYYYTPGYLTAHYVDPSTGCKSDDTQFFIKPAPDFDALLTGCHRMCDDLFPYNLPVYGIYPYFSTSLNWEWIYQPTGAIFSVTDQNPLLPIVGFGNYHLSATYTPGCTATSPDLEIAPAERCPCDSVEFKPKEVRCFVEDCKLYYSFGYRVCNYGSQTLTFDDLLVEMGGSVAGASPMPLVIGPNSCQDFYFKVEYTDFASTTLAFTLVDRTRNCEFRYVESTDWKSCVKKGCGDSKLQFTFGYDWSIPHQGVFFPFHLIVQNAQDILSVWSRPSQVFDYTVSSVSPVELDGLLMLDYGVLSQMAMGGQDICLYYVACKEWGGLCYDSVCMPAKVFLAEIPEMFRHLLDSITADNDTSVRRLQADTVIPIAAKPYLAPNPARDEVTVMGIAPEEVTEITVLTMQGGQVAEYRDTHRFSVSRLAKATYIVRVVTTDRKVHYLKLVKQ